MKSSSVLLPFVLSKSPDFSKRLHSNVFYISIISEMFLGTSDVSGCQKSGSGRVRVLNFFSGSGWVGYWIFFSGSGRVRVILLGFGSGFGFYFGI